MASKGQTERERRRETDREREREGREKSETNYLNSQLTSHYDPN